ncbi:MAG: hypothetical protein HQ510_01455 [Candidatus Marinimicrobia bacterium]|nr:hypothetical protein [Candidatus Neomarinimicrobiota bacterium]
MANFPYFRIFPQSWTGHYCGYCGKQHGKQEWRLEQSFPGEVFNSKKCLNRAIRERNAELKKSRRNSPKTKTERSLNMANYYPSAGSQGKYTNIWQSTTPAILEILEEGETDGSIELNSFEFSKVGNRKNYSFNLEILEGSVTNNISGSAVARDLAAILINSSSTMSILRTGFYKFRMDKNFTLWISKLGEI